VSGLVNSDHLASSKTSPPALVCALPKATVPSWERRSRKELVFFFALAHLGSLLLIDSTTKGRMRFERSIEPGAMAEREDDQSPRTQALALSNTSMRRTSWSID
jgi:hypothetical protein